MLLRTVVVEQVVPEFNANLEPVSYRIYTRSMWGWRYNYCLLHSTNQQAIKKLLSQFQVSHLEQLRGVQLAAYIDGTRLVRLAGICEEHVDRERKTL